MDTTTYRTVVRAELCRQLHALARAEEEAAAQEAARVPDWRPCPPSVDAHRQAARSLRATAYSLESTSDSLAHHAYPAELAG